MGEVAVDAGGRIYTTAKRKVLKYDGLVTTAIAGSDTGISLGDGRPPSEWRFSAPAGLIKDREGNLWIADRSNGLVRQITASGALKTVASGLEQPTGLAMNTGGRVFVSDAKANAIYTVEAGGKASRFSTGTAARPLMQPSGIAFDAKGDLYVADTGNNLIRRITPDGLAVIIAGGGGLDEDGPALTSRLRAPYGLAFDSAGMLWFTESGGGRLRKLDLGTGLISTTRKAEFKDPRGIAIDKSGNLYLADAGSNQIFKITPDERWWPIAGTGDRGFSGDDGPGLAGLLAVPSDLWVTDSGVLFSDSGNGRIRQLSTTAAGIGEQQSGPALPAAAASLSILHGGTKKIQPLAPGQLAIVSASLQLAGGGDVQILLGDITASVLSSKDGQWVIQIPNAAKIGRAAVSLLSGGQLRASGSADIVAASPALLAENGLALAANENGSINGPNNEAERGSIVSLFLTGTGVKPDPAIVADIGGIAAEILYAGYAPSMPGVFQLNVRVPGGFVPPGNRPVRVWVDGVQTQDGVAIATR